MWNTINKIKIWACKHFNTGTMIDLKIFHFSLFGIGSLWIVYRFLSLGLIVSILPMVISQGEAMRFSCESSRSWGSAMWRTQRFQRLANFCSTLSKKFDKKGKKQRKKTLKLKMFLLFFISPSPSRGARPMLCNENVNAATNLPGRIKEKAEVEAVASLLPTSSPICHKGDIVCGANFVLPIHNIHKYILLFIYFFIIQCHKTVRVFRPQTVN